VPNNSLVDIARRNALYAGMEHQAPQQKPFASDRSALLNGLASMAAFVPGLGDVAGLAADADMYATDPKSRNWKNYLLTGLGALPFVGGASLLGRATRNVPTGFGNQDGMIAYHGSPHQFTNVDEANPYGKFDTSRIGTGEGVQSFGHGLYLAELRDVAKQYRDALSTDVEVHGKQILSKNRRVGSTGDRDVDDLLIGNMGDLDKAIREASEYGDPGLQKLLDLKASGAVKRTEGGYIYTADLPDELVEKMIDWNAPLTKAPDEFKALIADIPRLQDPGIAGKSTIGEAYAELAGKMGGRKFASQALRDAGFPGIKYWDGESRTLSKGTRNFVVFDGSAAKIVGRE
jgi:hypothetical protein